MTFEKQIEVRWADADANRHVKHSTYYDYGAFIRFRMFVDIGFDSKAFAKLRIGPILFKEECTFIREIMAEETIRINMLNGGVSADGRKFTIHHEIFKSSGEKAAHISVRGAWMDLEKRKLTIPPKELMDSLNNLPLGEDYIYSKS